VWDYPRPPRAEAVRRRAVVTHGGTVVADTDDVVRVLETSHPPTWYLPRTAFTAGVLRPAQRRTVCEWKGTARYVDIVVPGVEPLHDVGWWYPQDAVYPTSKGPDILQSYSGAKRYVMHFDKGTLPPVKGFWSLTMYDAAYFFVDNPLNRYTLSQRDALKPNADGSVDLYIQNASPGKDKEANWLPAPPGKFILMMRLYWPNESNPSIIDGTWTIPPVRKVGDRA